MFGTSGHRGCSLDNAFNEAHILAITQAICLYRKQQGIDGPLFIGIDTHALSEPAFASALEVLAANGVEVMVDADNGYTPTPVISHAVLTYNRGRRQGLADGIVITPSHNPPRFGGFKYDPPTGGPADTHVTQWIEQQANAFIADGLRGVARVPFERARTASTTHPHPYRDTYWFAARPSGTESIYKIYAESFKDQTHLNAIVSEAQAIVSNALESADPGHAGRIQGRRSQEGQLGRSS